MITVTRAQSAAGETIASRTARAGFTLIELMVVLTVLALLLTLAVPRYFNHLERAKEATLKQDLSVMRDAIDKFHGDKAVSYTHLTLPTNREV